MTALTHKSKQVALSILREDLKYAEYEVADYRRNVTALSPLVDRELPDTHETFVEYNLYRSALRAAISHRNKVVAAITELKRQI